MLCLSFAHNSLLVESAIAKFLQNLHLFINLFITFYSDESAKKESIAYQSLAKG